MFTLWYERTQGVRESEGERSDIDLGSTKSWRLRPSPGSRLYGDGIGC